MCVADPDPHEKVSFKVLLLKQAFKKKDLFVF